MTRSQGQEITLEFVQESRVFLGKHTTSCSQSVHRKANGGMISPAKYIFVPHGFLYDLKCLYDFTLKMHLVLLILKYPLPTTHFIHVQHFSDLIWLSVFILSILLTHCVTYSPIYNHEGTVDTIQIK